MIRKPAVLAALVLGLVVLGCRTHPLLEVEPLPGTGDVESTRIAILKGMARHGWERVAESPGEVVARLVARQHMAEVKIAYGAERVAIRYSDSEGLLWRETESGGPVIHRAYNRWVFQLRKDIRAEVALARALSE